MVGSVSNPSLYPPNGLADSNRKKLLESSPSSQHDGRRTAPAPVRCQLVDGKDDCLKESASSKGGLCKAWTMYKEFEAFRSVFSQFFPESRIFLLAFNFFVKFYSKTFKVSNFRDSKI
jgi:hypothetical protein